ncbi:MAG: precorrin-3B C(17)-methyltransferase [Thermodesulfobacteriota bacterium]
MDRTRRAEAAIASAQVVVGYSRYLKLIEDLTQGKELLSTGMTKEVDRCMLALRRAENGDTVALVSSGDPGIYGMAGLALELAHKERIAVPIEVIPGVTSATALAARLGAPLMLDFAAISLSDLLVPWEVIKRRLEAVAAADLVVALYNPKSRKRQRQLDEATEIFLRHRTGATPVGIGISVGTDEEEIIVSDLDHFREFDITMRSVVIIANSITKLLDGWLVTPRGYRV